MQAAIRAGFESCEQGGHPLTKAQAFDVLCAALYAYNEAPVEHELVFVGRRAMRGERRIMFYGECSCGYKVPPSASAAVLNDPDMLRR